MQPEWLHNFLLDPYPIRPAVFLRMPKFNMSPAEAQTLVDYFAAKEGLLSPYEYSPADDRGVSGVHAGTICGRPRWIAAGRGHQNRGQLELLHQVPPGRRLSSRRDRTRALAPNLAMVQSRLRPEYVQRWIANPKRLLPYTNMPVNIPYDPTAEHLGGVAQDIYPGTSVDQLDALVDLLMNFSYYTNEKEQSGGTGTGRVRRSAAAATEETQVNGGRPAGEPFRCRATAQ